MAQSKVRLDFTTMEIFTEGVGVMCTRLNLTQVLGILLQSFMTERIIICILMGKKWILRLVGLQKI